jgi:thiamine transporter ThiT
LIFGAVAHFVTAFKGGGTKQVIGQMLIGLVYLIGGIYFLTHVFMAIGTLIPFHSGHPVRFGPLERSWA